MDRDSGFLHDVGRAAQFFVLIFEFAEVWVTSCKSFQPVLQTGIERVDILGVILLGCQQDGFFFILV